MMNMSKPIRLLLAGAAVAAAAFAIPAVSATPGASVASASTAVPARDTNAKFRFHCEKDTAEISEMLVRLSAERDKPLNEIVVAAARLLEGRPYVAHTLEGEPEMMVVNVDGLDCVTFVENCFALARTVSQGSLSWRDHARNLESLRYRRGEQKGYDSRLHYTTDWINDNVYRGNITDITTTLPDYRTVNKTLNFMTTHRSAYPALAVDSVYEASREIERGYHSMMIPYITKEGTKRREVVDMLQDGDMISFVSNKDGLDSSHVALLRIVDGKPYMMHASLKKGKVTFETEPLYDYLKYQKRDAPGVRVLRIT